MTKERRKSIARRIRLPRRRGERGVAILYVAVFLMASMWFVSMAIDVGKVMGAKTQLQAAADAAALAAASAIDPDTGDILEETARARAAAVAIQNKAFEGVPTPIAINPGADVDFPEPKQVRVTVHREAEFGNPVLLHFAQTLGMPSVNLRANATAEAQELNSVCEHLAPFGPEMPEEDFQEGCDFVYQLKLGSGGAGNGSGHGNGGGGGGGAGPTSGNFQLLDYQDCNEDGFTGGGAAAVAEYTLNGYGCCFTIGDEMTLTEPGNKVGPFRNALQERWNRDTDQTSSCYQDYHGNNERVFLTPIVESFDVNGKKSVRILKFAAFFLREPPGADMVHNGVTGQFIKYIAPGVASGPPVDTGIYGVHLVE